MKIGDIIAFAKINQPYSYGKIVDISFSIFIQVLYLNPNSKYNFLPNISSNPKHNYLKIVPEIDCTVITNKNRIEEIMHLHNKIGVFE